MICSYLSGCPKVWYLTKCLCFMFSRENYDWSLDCGCVFPNHGHCLHMHQRNRKWFKTHWKIKINWWYSKHINIYPPGIKMTLEKNIYNHINIYPPGIKMILEKYIIGHLNREYHLFKMVISHCHVWLPQDWSWPTSKKHGEVLRNTDLFYLYDLPVN